MWILSPDSIHLDIKPICSQEAFICIRSCLSHLTLIGYKFRTLIINLPKQPLMPTSLWTGVVNVDFMVFCIDWLLHKWLVQSFSLYCDIVRKFDKVMNQFSMDRLIIMCIFLVLVNRNFRLGRLFFRISREKPRNACNWVNLRNLILRSQMRGISGMGSFDFWTEFRKSGWVGYLFGSKCGKTSYFLNFLLWEILVGILR